MQASPVAVWEALLAAYPAPVASWPLRLWARVWDADPPDSNGLASHVLGAERPGLAVCEVVPTRTFAARGRHRFSRYQVVFTVEPLSASSSRLTAETFAVFPGTLGRLYRFVVIDLGPHTLVMRAALWYLRRRAESLRAATPTPS